MGVSRFAAHRLGVQWIAVVRVFAPRGRIRQALCGVNVHRLRRPRMWSDGTMATMTMTVSLFVVPTIFAFHHQNFQFVYANLELCSSCIGLSPKWNYQMKRIPHIKAIPTIGPIVFFAGQWAYYFARRLELETVSGNARKLVKLHLESPVMAQSGFCSRVQTKLK